MAGIKPLANIAETVASYLKTADKTSVLQTMPIKSGFKGLNLASLKKDTVAVTSEPKIVESVAAKKLKEFYNKRGVPFLLPNEEWSDKKVLDTVKLLGKKLDDLTESKTLNKQTLQETIDNLAPEAKGKIVIKDFGDLVNDLTAAGHSEEIIKKYVEVSEAITKTNPKKTTLYLRFDKLNQGKRGQILLKKSIEHEMTHAFASATQNERKTNIYKNTAYKCTKQQTIFDKIFQDFERNYERYNFLEQTELTEKNMLKHLGFESKEALHEDFGKTIEKLVSEESSIGNLNIDSGKKGWKQFFNSLKNHAKDEKLAYGANKRIREFTGDPNTPTDCELIPMVYAEMEKFFGKTRILINKQFPKG
jgi:hypothetical protein